MWLLEKVKALFTTLSSSFISGTAIIPGISMKTAWHFPRGASRSAGIIAGSDSAAMCKALRPYKWSMMDMSHFSWRQTWAVPRPEKTTSFKHLWVMTIYVSKLWLKRLGWNHFDLQMCCKSCSGATFGWLKKCLQVGIPSAWIRSGTRSFPVSLKAPQWEKKKLISFDSFYSFSIVVVFCHLVLFQCFGILGKKEKYDTNFEGLNCKTGVVHVWVFVAGCCFCKLCHDLHKGYAIENDWVFSDGVQSPFGTSLQATKFPIF